MKFVIVLMLSLLLSSCATTDNTFSTPQDSSRNIDPKYTQEEITSKISTEELDQNLSRFYSSANGAHLSAMPLTGALLDSIGFLKSAKDDYNKFEYQKVSASYRAYLYNKVSCFYIFAKGSGDLSDLSKYDVRIGNVGSEEQKAVVKSELEHQAIMRTLNEIFPKTYATRTPRSIDTNSQYSQELVCGNKIDFKKPFFIKFKSQSDDKTITELFWH